MKYWSFFVLLHFLMIGDSFACDDDFEVQIRKLERSEKFSKIYELGEQIRDQTNQNFKQPTEIISPGQIELYRKALKCFSISNEYNYNKVDALHNCAMIYWRLDMIEYAKNYFGQAVILGSDISRKNLEELEKLYPTINYFGQAVRLGPEISRENSDKLENLEKLSPTSSKQTKVTRRLKHSLKIMASVVLAYYSDFVMEAFAQTSRVILGPEWGDTLLECRHFVPYWSELQPYIVMVVSQIVMGFLINTFSHLGEE